MNNNILTQRHSVSKHKLNIWGLILQGVLRIHVIEAKDLMKKDVSVLGKGKSGCANMLH